MWFKTLVKSNLYFFIPFAAFVCVGGVLLSVHDKETLLIAINSKYSKFGDFLFQYYTHVGDGSFYLVLAFLILLFVSKYKAIVMIASYTFTSLIAQLIKYNIPGENFRPRSHFWLDSHRIHFVDGVEIMVSHSFPSGHTTSAFSMFLLFSIFVKNRLLSFVFFVMALMVGYSRMYLGQHFFADVYGGAIIGTFLTLITYYLLDSRWRLSERNSLKKGLFNTF
jgi:membrane-associated phospholipid phosphatase